MLIQNPRREEIIAELLAQRTARPRPDLVRPLAEVERATIESAMILCEGNRGLAASRLGISRKTLTTRIAEYRAEA